MPPGEQRRARFVLHFVTTSVLVTSVLIAAVATPWLKDDGSRFGPRQRQVLRTIGPLLDPDGREELEGEPIALFPVHLDGDRHRDYVVQLTNDDAFCTAEGCLSFVLRGGKHGFQVVGRFYGWRIRPDRKRRGGLRDLVVRVSEGQERRYVFKGRRYALASRRSG